jgi:hypothetical protein
MGSARPQAPTEVAYVSAADEPVLTNLRDVDLTQVVRGGLELRGRHTPQ